MEDNSINDLGKEVLTDLCVRFCNIIEANKYWAGIYANKDWFKNKLNYNNLKSRYTLWVAEWAEKNTISCDLWQYSSSGIINGISSATVDLNYLYRDLIEEIKASKIPDFTVAPEEPKKEDNYITYEVLSNRLNIRKENNANSDILGTFGKGNKIAVFEVNGTWGRTDKGWVNLNYTSWNPNYKEPQGTIYTVVGGDTLTSIAKKFNTTWLKIYEKNKKIIGDNPNLIKVGQKLII